VLAGWSVQELYDLTREAFEVADRYRNPVVVLGDAMLGQMMEPVVLPEGVVDAAMLPRKPWATDGATGRKRNIINSLYIHAPDLEQVNLRMQKRYQEAAEREVRCAMESLEDADIAVIAYGTAGRIAVSAVEQARAQGIRAGLFRPITLFPFPERELAAVADRVKAFLVVELSLGQMVEDIERFVAGRRPVRFLGRTGGVLITPAEVVGAIERLAAEAKS